MTTGTVFTSQPLACTSCTSDAAVMVTVLRPVHVSLPMCEECLMHSRGDFAHAVEDRLIVVPQAEPCTMIHGDEHGDQARLQHALDVLVPFVRTSAEMHLLFPSVN